MTADDASALPPSPSTRFVEELLARPKGLRRSGRDQHHAVERAEVEHRMAREERLKVLMGKMAGRSA